MSEWNHGLLVENIRGLLKHNNLTQQQLAEITEMTQANVSKALNPNDKRSFTLEQVVRISQHFGISIDELVGNKVPSEVATSPRAVLAFLSKLLCELKVRATDISAEELVYEQYLNEDNYPDCRRVNRTIKYPAFYFPDYVRPGDIAADEHEYDELDSVYCWCGNESNFLKMNEILKNLIPMIQLYREKQIPEEAFQMILNGYLEKLPEK